MKKNSNYLNSVVYGNSIDFIKNIEDSSIELILSDIPYGIAIDEWDVLHNNNNSALLGSSPSQEKIKGGFKKRGKPLNGWSESDKQIPKQYYEWCLSWASEWLRVLKAGSSVIVFAGRRLAPRCVCALEDSGFIFKDMLAWIKPTAYFKAQKLSIIYQKRKDFVMAEKWSGWRLGNLRPLFEPILWFVKPYKIGSTIADNVINNGVGAFNEIEFKKLNKSDSNVLYSYSVKTDSGLHLTQKPIDIAKSLISLLTIEGQTVLDPFCGSGTTLVASKELKRDFIGIEKNENICEIAKNRLKEQNEEK